MKLPDWMARISTIHKAAYKEEEPPIMVTNQPRNIVSLAGLNSQQASAAYQQAVSVNQNYGYLTTNNTGYAGPTIAGAAGYIQQVTYSSTAPMQWSNLIINNGAVVPVSFTDAHGNQINLMVDQAHYQILDQVSRDNRARLGLVPLPPTYTPSPKPTPMLEGDFSFDEMEKAEDLIKEMNDGSRAEARP